MNKIAEITSTVFYIGRIPLAPGTFCSFIAFLAWFYLRFYIEGVFILYASLILFFVGVAVTTIHSEVIKKEDPPEIVIDEWVGQWITFTFMPVNLANFVIGLTLFRFFDIIKPFPVKSAEKLSGGWGVMMDDVIAGIMSFIILCILNNTIL